MNNFYVLLKWRFAEYLFYILSINITTSFHGKFPRTYAIVVRHTLNISEKDKMVSNFIAANLR